ncbi:MAG: hypothetical protein H7X95_02845, partial [Deltaproteobacteria bacterium]|nr:hypothetical protein [Deltaproteobacteria bacterium]
DRGFRVGRDLPFDMSHRHYSHMMGVYPLHILDWDDAALRPVIQRSYDNWASLQSAWAGYSWTGAASFNAIFGKGNVALPFLQTFLDRSLLPNTMYTEGSPVIETPLSGARTLQDLLLGSWGGVLRVFPAIPDAWKDVVVHDLGAEGAFRVSAVRKAGVTQFVRVKSLAGEPCRIRTDLARPLTVTSKRPLTLTERTDGTFDLDLRRDEEAVVTSRGTAPDLTVRAIPSTPSWCANYYARKTCGAPAP